MGPVDEAAADYRGVIVDLHRKLDFAKRQVEELPGLIERLEQLAGVARMSTQITTQPSFAMQATVNAPVASAMEDHISQLSVTVPFSGMLLSDACVRAIELIGRPATNKEILEMLRRHGFSVQSANPVNNVGSSLNHRRKSKGDVQRNGKHWSLRKETHQQSEPNGCHV